MAEKKTEAQAPVAVKAEELYDAVEIAQAAPKLFGMSVDIATAALEFKGIEKCSLAEAKKTIREFAERKVN